MVSTYSEAGVDIDASERATEALIAQIKGVNRKGDGEACLLYTSPSPRDKRQSRMPSSA